MTAESPHLIPVSQLNTYVYCPRRFYLEHNQGVFEDNQHTVEGREAHHAVDEQTAKGRTKGELVHRHSVQLSSERLGIIGKLDLLEENQGEAYPVEYKKGRKPPEGKEPWPNDLVQLCAQALLLRDSGMAFPAKACLYYIGSRARVEVPLTPELIERTENAIRECRALADSSEIPPLADNRNKCFGCSLNAICLPEEEQILRGQKANAKAILPSCLDGTILYVDTIGAYLGVSEGSTVNVTVQGEKIASAALETLREILLCGFVQTSTQLVHACLQRQVPIHYLTSHGKYAGMACSALHHHGALREAQWQAHFSPETSLDFAKKIVRAKIANLRTLCMRYGREERSELRSRDIERMKDLSQDASHAPDAESLRGYEGMASKLYFSHFEEYLKPERRADFPFKDRNRRPPRDPVNSLLSFGYSLLAKDCTATAARVGFDPYCGFYHTMKYGRPSLALDIMEFFRQPIVDSTVLTAINNGVFKEGDFLQYQNVCYLNEKGRKKFLLQYESRKKDSITHPDFHYRLSYERTVELQFRIIGKFLLREINDWEGFHIR